MGVEDNQNALTSSHWGVGVVKTTKGRIVSVNPRAEDRNPSRINENIAGSLNGKARVLRPAFRKSWLEGHPGKVPRGQDSFIELEWPDAIDRIAMELTRIRKEHGNESIFAGSYGWSSAGRFHHAQSMLKRFLNTQGGFVASEGNYSYNAALGLMPYIAGNFREHVAKATRWKVIARHTKLVVAFGGLASRNMQISDGGISSHIGSENLRKCAQAGVRFINISPLRTDMDNELAAKWLAPKPGTDTAIMMGLAHTLIAESRHDKDFLNRYTTGFEELEAYLLGRTDGIIKNAAWAAKLSGISEDTIRNLAIEMADNRTMITVAAGLQRADYGEQPLWMAVSLAAMLGQIGLPGGGYTIGYAVNGNVGNRERLFRWGAIEQGHNPVDIVIPVAMISELLMNPGRQYPYKGNVCTFPDIRLVWWAGGNPFHHHQDLNRLRRAFQKPETIIVNEINWTSTARHADIVLPVAAAQERNDFGGGKSDNALVPMPAHAPPPGEARCEYDIYSDLARTLGDEHSFTQGRDEAAWLRSIWKTTMDNARQSGVDLPDWDTFIRGDVVEVSDPSPDQVFLAEFRADPEGNRLPTPSGRIEIFSQTIADYKLPDCPGHPVWFAPRDVTAGLAKNYPLNLLSGQPKTRLHSQLDNGSYSLSHKIKGREPIIIHPVDAARRGISDGDIVEIFNSRGRCLAGARLSEDIKEGCIFLWTGAWYDPDYEAFENRDRHGNPNVLTHDYRTSSLTQSPAAHSALVEVRKFEGDLPEITVHDPPQFITIGKAETTAESNGQA